VNRKDRASDKKILKRAEAWKKQLLSVTYRDLHYQAEAALFPLANPSLASESTQKAQPTTIAMQLAAFPSKGLRCYRSSIRIPRRPAANRLLAFQLRARYFSSPPTEPPLSTQKPRATDATAKRPNQVCDPYGQGGKPLAAAEVKVLLSTIDKEWKVEQQTKKIKDENEEEDTHPVALTREFRHTDFLAGSRFLHRLAAVAELNAHFPVLTLERRIVKKNWVTVSTARCHTTVLGGLSRHDFHLAMVRKLLVRGLAPT